ncbi:replication factor C large subunit [Patescibacteria group bacterium]|nr:replication factor C large subunit [Patescibacteria group bacterium]
MNEKESWTEKYRPKYFSELKGQELPIQQIKEFLNNLSEKKNKKKAIILHGPPGIGKTTIAYIISNEKNAEIFELNASDLRNNEKIKEILKPVAEQQSLTKKMKIILIDEVDGISEVDRGGISALLNVIESTNYPILITANDIWDKKFSDLRKRSECIQLKEINYRIIKDVLIEILRKERKFIENDILTNIAMNARGDLRAAINDLQMAANLEDPSKILVYERDKETDIFSALRMIFKGKPTNNMLNLFDSINKPIDEIMLWVEENIPLEYQGEELARALDLLSKADIFKRRIYKQQYWRFLVYENAFLSYGISSAKNSNSGIDKKAFTSYKKPTRILKIWMNNQKVEKKKTIAKKYAKYVHIGEKRALKEFSIIKQFLLKPEIQKELKLSEGEISYLESK